MMSLPSRLRRLSSLVLLLVATTAMVVPPWVFIRWREVRLAAVSTPEAQAEWNRFRDRMRSESGRDGPVQRKVPRSEEPPERVWLRDYWRLAIAAWVVFVGLIAGFTALLLHGAVTSAAEHGPRRDGDHEEQHERDAQNADERKHTTAPAGTLSGKPRGLP